MVARLVGTCLAALLVCSAAATLYAHDVGMGIVRYNGDGSLDTSFGRGGVVSERTAQGGLSPEALAIQADGRAVLGGTASDLATAAVGFGLARYNADGSLDSGFGANGRVLTRVGAATAEAHAIALQPDGSILLAGSGYGAESAAVSEFAVARYTPVGAVDRDFGSGVGVVLTPIAESGAEARAVCLQPDGRIVVAGTAFASGTMNDGLALARYQPDGSLDPEFGSGGIVVTPFETTGDGSNPFRTAALVVQRDGKLVAVGSVGGHQGAFALARYLPNGDLDTGFGLGGRVITTKTASAQAYAAALQPDGNIVVAGGLGAASESVAFAVARYRPSGDLDTGFGSNGFAATVLPAGSSGAHALALGSNGDVLAAGSGYASALPPQQTGSVQSPVNGGFAVVRFLPNGLPDASFGTDGLLLTTLGDAGSMPAALAFQADDKLVAAGLTYFLVPPSIEERIVSTAPLLVGLAATAVLAAGLLVRRRRASAPRR